MVKNLMVMTTFVILLFLIAPGVMGASLDMQVSTGQQPPNKISSCPDSVISDIEVMLTNLGSQTDTIELTLDWPSDMGFIKPFVTLASGERMRVSPFWITLSYNMEPGVYHAKVTAESSQTGDKVTRDIEIEVMRCYSVYVISEDDYEQSCKEAEEPVVYELEIGNQGKWTETFELSASVDWAEFSKDQVTVDAGDTEVVSLVLNPPAGVSSGMHTIFVTARSIESYAVDTASLEMEVVDCFEFSADLDPESQSACLGESRDYDLIITNMGDQEDEYTIEVPGWVFPDRTLVELDGGESETIVLTVVPETEGIHRFDVTVSSERDDAAAPVKLSGMIDADECRGVAVIVIPSEASVCKGEDVGFSVSIKNTGTVEEAFGIEASFGELEEDSITLEGGKADTIGLSLDTSDLPEGKVVIDVTASDENIVDTATAEVEVEQCFGAELSLRPDDVTVCPGADIPYTIEVTNNGKQADEYTVMFADKEEEISLEPGESDVMSYNYQIPYVDEGRYLFTVEVESEGGIELLETSEINLKSSESCYGVELEDDMGVVEIGKATTVEIGIKNTGEQSDNFMVEVADGPDWAYLQPEEIHLGGNEEGTIYLYLSPGFGVKKDTYTVTIDAYSDNTDDTLDVTVIVPENMTDVPDIEPEEPGSPEEPEGPEEPTNVTINVTHPEEPSSGEEPVTGGAVEERPFWKTAAVALIALIIVAILVLRFVLLLKK